MKKNIHVMVHAYPANHVDFFKGGNLPNNSSRSRNNTRKLRRKKGEEDNKEEEDELEIQEYIEKLIEGWQRHENATRFVQVETQHIVIRPRPVYFVESETVSDDNDVPVVHRRNPSKNHVSDKNRKSDNFEVLLHSSVTFADVGGYQNIKDELMQCVDLLQNYTKYAKYNVRTPKGLILEGPPGNGKTLLAKAFAGECGTGFLPVSGSQFQDKYVGVGAGRIREMFELAKKNIPCVIFIDEIDAVGRARTGEGEGSNAERDSTLNELLVALDGFHNTSGVFLMGSTNRADLLDPALIRPGRIDKRIYLSLPDEKTRHAILNIHIRGKPHDMSVALDDIVYTTDGLSAAQIENVLNEAMLHALRCNRDVFTQIDLDVAFNRIVAGWQAVDHAYTNETLFQISVHEMGHAIIGALATQHAKVKKIVLNLSSPNSPGYTIFEQPGHFQSRESLKQHLMVLLGGRVAEEIIFGHDAVSTGAINDFEEAFKLANKMVLVYGMGGGGNNNTVTPSSSEKYKAQVDEKIDVLIKEAIQRARTLLLAEKQGIIDAAHALVKEKTMPLATLNQYLTQK